MTHDLWIFGYGSLVWNPGFDVAERCVARLDGYRRAFSMRSIEHRGTRERPGLVLALERLAGAECAGVAMRVEPDRAAPTLDYLRARELVTDAYVEVRETITLSDGRQPQAVTYVIDPAHWQYAGDLTLAEQAEIIAAAVGGRGPNPEYLFGTVDALRAHDIADAELEEIARLVAARTGAAFA